MWLFWLCWIFTEIEQTVTVKFDRQNIKGAPAAGHLSTVELVVQRGAKVNHQTCSGSTPVRAACIMGRLDIVKFLVKNGADFTISNIDKNTCLLIACYNSHYDIVKFLVEKGAHIDSKDCFGSTALPYAA